MRQVGALHLQQLEQNCHTTLELKQALSHKVTNLPPAPAESRHTRNLRCAGDGVQGTSAPAKVRERERESVCVCVCVCGCPFWRLICCVNLCSFDLARV
jgi:hypothetical protein